MHYGSDWPPGACEMYAEVTQHMARVDEARAVHQRVKESNTTAEAMVPVTQPKAIKQEKPAMSREQQIAECCELARLPEAAKDFINRGLTVDQVRGELIDALVNGCTRTATPTGQIVEVRGDWQCATITTIF